MSSFIGVCSNFIFLNICKAQGGLSNGYINVKHSSSLQRLIYLM